MATNNPAKKPNVQRVAVTAAIELQFDFEGIVGVIDLSLQVIESVQIRISFDPGGTFSTDNYWTLKSGDVWSQQDINWIHARQLYLRSEAGTVTAEIMYWA